MKVFVTGADGILGNNLVRLLLEKGYEVRVFIQTGKKAEYLETLNIEKVYGDILDADGLEQAVAGCDIVIHAAANTGTWPCRHQIYWDINVEGTRNVIEAVKKQGVKKMLHIGTANSFGAGSKAQLGHEENAYDADRYKLDYISSKYRAQCLVLEEVKANGLPAVVLNPTFMIGPYDSKPSSGKMLLAIYKKEVPGYAKGGRNFVYVKDVANAIINAIEFGKTGECYILGNENLNYREIFDKMASSVGVKSPKFGFPKGLTLAYGWMLTAGAKLFGREPVISYPLALISTEEHFYSSAKAVRELKMPQTPLKDALEDAVNWFKENGYMNN